MRVVFTIPGDETKYSYPSTPDDVTFGQFVTYLDEVYTKAPQVLKDIEQAITDGDEERVQELSASLKPKVLAREMYPYFARVVSFFTNVPISILLGEQGPGMNVKQLEAVYHVIMGALAPPPGELGYEKEIDFNGETWVLPDRLMENANVIEFAEAAQFQAAMADVKDGHFRSMIDVCAVLLRKPGEAYSDNIYKRNKRLFNDLPLSAVWRVAFFLMRQSEKLSRAFLIYTASQTSGQLRRELKTSLAPMVGT